MDHVNYLKGTSALTTATGQSWSWIVRSIWKQQSLIDTIKPCWDRMTTNRRFSAKLVYRSLTDANPKVPWYKILNFNLARPKAKFILWLLLHEKLATKERLSRFGILNDSICSLCNKEVETIEHLSFICSISCEIWTIILKWTNIHRVPKPWQDERVWLITHCKGKGWRAGILKLALAETVYGIWKHRNDMIFGGLTNIGKTVDNILDCIVYRGWRNRKIREHLVPLML